MSNQSDAMKELIQRFAISALSRERKNEALNEEILAGKYTGEFYIKTKDGLVLSADIANRMKAVSHEAVRLAELLNMTGEIFRVDFENIVLPGFIDYNSNILQPEPIELPVAKEVLLYLDIDEYDVSNNIPTPVQSDGNVKLLFEVVKDGISSYERVDKTLSSINYYSIPITDYEKVSSIKLINITISKDDKVYTEYGANRIMVLHNVFVTLNY